jgi:hypothetical protein
MVPAGNALGVLSRKFHIPPLKNSGIKRRSGFSGTRQYLYYAECLKNHCNVVDGTFYDAIKVDKRSYIIIV